MKNKKSLAAIAILLAVAVVGGTFAYFQFSEQFDNLFHVGSSEVSFTETFDPPRDWTPCTETPKVLTVDNTSGFAVNARVLVTERWDKLDSNGEVDSSVTLPLTVNNQSMAIIHFANPSDWVQNATDGYYYYQGDIASGSSSSQFIDYVTFNCNAGNDYNQAKYHLELKVETVQADSAARQAEGWNY